MLLILFFTMATHAQSFTCPDSREAEEVLRTFRFRDFDARQRVDLCSRDSLGRKLVDALVFLKNLHWQNAARDEFNTGLLPDEPYRFVVPRIRELILTDSSSPYCGEFVGGRNSGDGRVYICSYARSMSVFEVAAVLVHEARHSDREGGGFPHVDCETGRPAGADAKCDLELTVGGSYAVGAEFALKVSRDSSLPEEVRENARRQVIEDYNWRFMRKPFGMRPGVVLQADDGRLSFFDGRRETDLNLQLDPRFQAVSLETKDLVTVYDANSGRATRTLFPAVYLTAPDVLSSYFSLRMSGVERAAARDYFIGRDFACVTAMKTLRCLDSNGEEILNLDLGPLAARGFMDLTRSTPVSQRRLFLVADGGEAFPLPMTVMELRALRTDDLLRTGVATNMLNLATFGDSRIALLTDGSVQTRVGDGAWKPAYALKGRRFVKLMGPIEWSERLLQLSKP